MAGGVDKGQELSNGNTDCFIRVLTGMCSDKQESRCERKDGINCYPCQPTKKLLESWKVTEVHTLAHTV